MDFAEHTVATKSNIFAQHRIYCNVCILNNPVQVFSYDYENVVPTMKIRCKT